MFSARPSRTITNVAAAAVLVTLAACGSDSDESAQPGDDPAPADVVDEPVAEPEPEPATEPAPQPEAEPAPGPQPEAEPAPEPAPADSEADVEAATSSSTGSAVTTSAFFADYTLDDEEFGTQVTVTIDGSTRTIESNSLPNHETGEFPNANNPNEISEQSLSFEFTTEPVHTGVASFAQTPGVAVNGVTFEPGTAETVTCDSGEVYRIEALQDLYDLGLDVNNAHVQPGGQYHYHGVSDLLAIAADSGDDLVHVGFASDGFLVYYSMSGEYESGYVLSTEERTGTGCVASGPAGGDEVTLAGTNPDGTYTSDWVWVEDAGDLDECNGTWVDGEYFYVLTEDYPYIPRCLFGEVAESASNQVGAPPGRDG